MPEVDRRREGFAGQHLIVLPQSLQDAARRHPLLRGLYVTDAGYFPQAVGHLVTRPGGASTTLLLLCMRGAGWVDVDGTRQKISAGDAVWFPPNLTHAYGADDSDPWSIAWAHFAGEEVTGWRNLLFPSGRAKRVVLELPRDRLAETGFEQVVSPLERGLALRHQVASAAILRGALSTMAELVTERREMRSARERVATSIEKMRRDWLHPFRLEELATTTGLSVSRYSALFRAHAGFSPIDFLIRLRVQRAAQMLDRTSLPIAEIATQTGFQDPYYFSRCFRKVMGTSPRQYRSIPKG